MDIGETLSTGAATLGCRAGGRGTHIALHHWESRLMSTVWFSAQASSQAATRGLSPDGFMGKERKGRY